MEMNVYYYIEFQSSGLNVISKEVLLHIENMLGVSGRDIEEREPRRVTFFFKSIVKPSEMRKRMWKILNTTRSADNHECLLHYVDVVYRWDYELNADRFVLWSDGNAQEYTGKMIFEEDK